MGIQKIFGGKGSSKPESSGGSGNAKSSGKTGSMHTQKGSKKVKEEATSMKSQLKGLAKKGTEKTQGAYRKAKALIGRAPEPARREISKIIEEVETLATRLEGKAESLGEKVERKVTEKMEKAEVAFDEILESHKTELTGRILGTAERRSKTEGFFKKVERQLNSVVDEVGEFFQEIGEELSEEANSAKEELMEGLGQIRHNSRSRGMSALQELETKVEHKIEDIGDSFDDMHVQFKRKVESVSRGLSFIQSEATGADTLDEYFNKLEGFINGIKDLFRHMKRDIGRFFSKMENANADFYTELRRLLSKLKRDISG